MGQSWSAGLQRTVDETFMRRLLDHHEAVTVRLIGLTQRIPQTGSSQHIRFLLFHFLVLVLCGRLC